MSRRGLLEKSRPAPAQRRTEPTTRVPEARRVGSAPSPARVSGRTAHNLATATIDGQDETKIVTHIVYFPTGTVIALVQGGIRPWPPILHHLKAVRQSWGAAQEPTEARRYTNVPHPRVMRRPVGSNTVAAGKKGVLALASPSRGCRFQREKLLREHQLIPSR